MRALAVLFVLTSSACSLRIQDGQLTCASNGGKCPRGYHCAIDLTCWREGHEPAVGGDGFSPFDLGPGKGLGESCASRDDCSTHICGSQGVCCDTACEATCESCTVAGAEGTCRRLVGPPTGGRSCKGDTIGACAGSCDGSSGACVYPSTSAVCGGNCSDQCDGAGHCPSAAAGACPNGFACGGPVCLSSCQGNNNCQPLYQCNLTTHLCERFPEPDCFDGTDDNLDGNIDCADPTCGRTRAQCVDPANGTNELGTLGDTCGVGFTQHLAFLFQGLVASVCAGCACVTHTRCNYYMDFYNSNGVCAGASEAQMFFSLYFPSQCDPASYPNGGSNLGDSGSDTRSFMMHHNGSLSSATAMLAVTCTKPPASWNTSKRFCKLNPSAAGGCRGAQICAPIALCKYTPGMSGACTDPKFPSARFAGSVWYEGADAVGAVTDTRTCSCGTPTVDKDGTCPDQPPAWTGYENSSCPPVAGIDARFTDTPTSGACKSYQNNVNTWGATIMSVKNASTLPLADAKCTSPTVTTGSAVGKAPAMVCCQ